MGLPRQEYWSGLPLPFSGIFLTQGSNPHLLRWQASALPLSYQGSLKEIHTVVLIIQALPQGMLWVWVPDHRNKGIMAMKQVARTFFWFFSIHKSYVSIVVY